MSEKNEKKKCPNCQAENDADELFCGGCGLPLQSEEGQPSDASGEASEAAIAATPPEEPPATAPPPAPIEPPVATLSFGGKDFPLAKGARFLIAREGSEKCQPDLAIDSDQVSSTPITVEVDENGTIKVRDGGSSSGIRVVKHLKPGKSMKIKPGETIMLGNNFINVS